MTRRFTKTERQWESVKGFFRKFADAIITVIGVLLIIAGTGLLLLTESCVNQSYNSTRIGNQTATIAEASAVSPDNEGKLVLISGQLTTDPGTILTDSKFTAASLTNGVMLSRKVELCQWDQIVNVDNQFDGFGAGILEPDSNYKRIWSNELVNDHYHRGSFKNPDQFHLSSESFINLSAQIGAYTVSEHLLKNANLEEKRLKLSKPHPNLPWNQYKDWNIRDNYFYSGNPDTPEVGDYRVHFMVVLPQLSTAVGQQSGNTLIPHAVTVKEGTDSIAQLNAGQLSIDQMMESRLTHRLTYAWYSRGIAWVLMWVGICFMFVKWNTLDGFWTGFTHHCWEDWNWSLMRPYTIPALGLTLLVIGGYWFQYEPLRIGTPLTLGASTLFFLFYRFQNKPNLDQPIAPSSTPTATRLAPDPAPEEPKHSDLNAVYELCTLYLVALDEQFTPEEQELVDQHFGPGTSERFIERLPMMNWTEQFSVLHDMVQRLSPTDRFALKSKGRAFFQSILAIDEITNMERSRFDDLMRFLEESME